MDYSNELYIWMLEVLFVIGILLLPVGIGFILFPDKIFKLANRLNRWIETDSFFNKLNEPHFKERYFYRHHRIAGTLITLISLVCLYMLMFYTSVGDVTDHINKLAESDFEKLFSVSLYYLLIGAIFLAFIFGLVIFIRPSALKKFESWGNQWIDTDGPSKMMDIRKDIPDKILPGNPRIFGFFVLVGAIYIIWRTFPM